jgi:hypothetical protein
MTDSEMTDERLRQLYAHALRERGGGGAGAPAVCEVEPASLLALARGELGEDERLALFDRVMASEACRQEFALAHAAVVADRELSGAAAAGMAQPGEADRPTGDAAVLPLRVASGAAHSAPRPPRTRRWWGSGVPVALAATLLLAVGITRWGGRAVEPVMRSALDGVVLATPPDGAQTEPSPAFAWHPVVGAQRYEFELLDADAAPVYQTTTADTSVALPAAITLRPGVTYRWLVRALDDAGQPRGSAVSRLRVRGA